VFGAIPGEDTGAIQAAAPSPTARPTAASGAANVVRPSAATGLFVTGTIWEDTRKRNGILDDNEGPLPVSCPVTVVIERVDTPGVTIPCATRDGSVPANINPADSTGKYRCNVPLAGTYRVSIIIPPDYEATTSRQREVTITATEGGVANFGLGHLDPRIRVIGGVGSQIGPIIGVVIFWFITDRFEDSDTWRFIILGSVAVVMAAVARSGVNGLLQRIHPFEIFPVRRRLRQDEP